MQQVVLASSNAGKLREIRHALQDLALEFVSQQDLQIVDAHEDGVTFIENALIKARHAARHSGLPALADDSGLMVPALQNRPGVYSARYAGAHTSYPQKMASLLAEWHNSGSQDKRICFYCVMAYLQHADDPAPIIATGQWWGEISADFSGNQGFGYDPMFYVPETDCTASELSLEDKNRLSHRGAALRGLRGRMQELCGGSAVE